MVCDDGSDTEDSFSDEEETEVEGVVVRGAGLPSISGELGSESAPVISVSSDGSITLADGTDTSASSAGEVEAGKKEAKEEERKKDNKAKDGKEGGEGEGPDDKGDPEMAPMYLQRLLPTFTEIYHSSLAPALRKESLRLMRKMCHYITTKCLQDLCQEATPSDTTQPLFSARISEVLAAVMETEDDHEAHLSALHIMQDLLGKNRVAFDEQFIRLGLPNKIAALAGLLESEAPQETERDEANNGGNSGIATEEAGGGKPDGKVLDAPDCEDAKPPEEKVSLDDAADIVVTTPYQWRDWCMVRSRDCLYFWNDYCVIELSNVSNGWFRFLVDSRLATMYSSGSTEGGPDSYGELLSAQLPNLVVTL